MILIYTKLVTILFAVFIKHSCPLSTFIALPVFLFPLVSASFRAISNDCILFPGERKKEKPLLPLNYINWKQKIFVKPLVIFNEILLTPSQLFQECAQNLSSLFNKYFLLDNSRNFFKHFDLTMELDRSSRNRLNL